MLTVSRSVILEEQRITLGERNDPVILRRPQPTKDLAG